MRYVNTPWVVPVAPLQLRYNLQPQVVSFIFCGPRQNTLRASSSSSSVYDCRTKTVGERNRAPTIFIIFNKNLLFLAIFWTHAQKCDLYFHICPSYQIFLTVQCHPDFFAYTFAYYMAPNKEGENIISMYLLAKY